MAITLSTEAMVGVIVGSVVGGILLLLFFGLIAYCCCCRPRKRRPQKSTPYVPEIRANGHINRPVSVPKASLTPSVDDVDAEMGKAVGYAYPIVGGRPVSYPYFGSNNFQRSSASPPSSTGTKTSNPVKRQPSQGLPPNAYRLPGLADKSFSMSDNNLSTAGTVNPAYDATGDRDVTPRHVYRTQSLINVDRSESELRGQNERNNNFPRIVSNVYQYDGSLGRVTDRPQEKRTSSTNRKDVQKRLASCNEEAAESVSPRHSGPPVSEGDRRSGQFKIRVAHELEAADHVYALPNKQKKVKAPEPPKGLPRIPLETSVEDPEANEVSEGLNSTSAARRSLTSEMSYRAKGHLVTDQAFDFLEGYNDDVPKS